MKSFFLKAALVGAIVVSGQTAAFAGGSTTTNAPVTTPSTVVDGAIPPGSCVNIVNCLLNSYGS